MRYWDSSAIVPLVLEEPTSDRVDAILVEDAVIATLTWSTVEVISAVERRVREETMTRAERREAIDKLDSFAAEWDEIADVHAVRTRTRRLLARHPLRATDAAQLGAAQLVRDQVGEELGFVCLDDRLATAAESEGFRVRPLPKE